MRRVKYHRTHLAALTLDVTNYRDTLPEKRTPHVRTVALGSSSPLEPTGWIRIEAG
jgi:hypothetical protein